MEGIRKMDNGIEKRITLGTWRGGIQKDCNQKGRKTYCIRERANRRRMASQESLQRNDVSR